MAALDPPRHEDLKELPVEALALPEGIIAIPRELLCESATTLLLPLYRANKRSQNPLWIHPRMLIEARVLPCQQRSDEIRRHLGNAHRYAILTLQSSPN